MSGVIHYMHNRKIDRPGSRAQAWSYWNLKHRLGSTVTTLSGRWLGRSKGLHLSLDLLEQLLPFLLVLNGETIAHAGNSLTLCLNQGPLQECSLSSLFRLLEPSEPSGLAASDLEQLLDRPLRLEADRVAAGDRVPLLFAGQLVALQGPHRLLAMTPLPASLEELHRYGLSLQDLALHDLFRQTFLDRLMADGLQELVGVMQPSLGGEPACDGCLEDLEALVASNDT